MGQKASTTREFTPDAKPPKRENEENSLKATQKRLGVNVIQKDSKMTMKTESFIVDAIVIEKKKHSGNSNEIANEIALAIKQKLDGQFCGFWNVMIKKESLAESGYAISYVSGSHIQLTYESDRYSVFRIK